MDSHLFVNGTCSVDHVGRIRALLSQVEVQRTPTVSADVRLPYIPESAMRGALLSFGFPEWQADGLIEDYRH